MSRWFSLTRALRNLGTRKEPYLLGLLHDLHQAPALGSRKRAGLHQGDPVAHARFVVLVVHLDLAGAAENLGVATVLLAVLELDHDRLVHLVRDDVALADLTVVAAGAGLGVELFAHAAPSLSASGDTDRPSS